ncbi:MAG: rhomboid family intramembrane serine protease [Hyphomicrobiaceae bacterium]|nr:rhomboid family intramembrane serine protease [Hyphomicrobiaceae bacterium]
MFPIRDTLSWQRFPAVVAALILVNVLVYVYQLSLSQPELQHFLYHHGLVPKRYFVPSWGEKVGLSPLDLSPFATNMFLHGGLFHIATNLWTLWIFGPALEERLGSGRFLFLYFVAGVVASVAHAIFNANSPIPALGASGAIAGIIAAYATRFPYAWIKVLVLIVIIPVFFYVPALLFAGIWFLIQVLQGTSTLFVPGMGQNVAWWAHIGGFVAGWFLLTRIDPTGGPWARTAGHWRSGYRNRQASSFVDWRR